MFLQRKYKPENSSNANSHLGESSRLDETSVAACKVLLTNDICVPVEMLLEENLFSMEVYSDCGNFVNNNKVVVGIIIIHLHLFSCE
jgi:hypothetical protein